MRKARVTKKWVMNSFRNVYICDPEIESKIAGIDSSLSSFLPYPYYYTCGVYGWNADVYVLDYNTVIVSGYRPFGHEHISLKQLVQLLKERKKGREIN